MKYWAAWNIAFHLKKDGVCVYKYLQLLWSLEMRYYRSAILKNLIRSKDNTTWIQKKCLYIYILLLHGSTVKFPCSWRQIPMFAVFRCLEDSLEFRCLEDSLEFRCLEDSLEFRCLEDSLEFRWLEDSPTYVALHCTHDYL